MLDKEEKNAALSDKKKRMWVHKCFSNRKSEGVYWTSYKESADDEMKFYLYFRMSKKQFSYLLQKIIFTTCIFTIFCEIKARPKWYGEFWRCGSNLTKIPNQGGSVHQSAFEVRDKFKQFFNSPSGSVPWQNERLQCQVVLQYSATLDGILKTLCKIQQIIFYSFIHFYSVLFYSILVCYQPYSTTAAECIFRCLLITRSSVIIEW